MNLLLHPLGISLWFSIPLLILTYLGIALGDTLIWRYLAEGVTTTAWGGPDNSEFVRNSDEAKRYRFYTNLSEAGIFWPVKYVVLVFLALAYGVITLINILLDYVSNSASKSRDRRMLPARQKRYQELYDQVMNFHPDYSEMSWKQQPTWKEFKALEQYVTPLPDVRKERWEAKRQAERERLEKERKARNQSWAQ